MAGLLEALCESAEEVIGLVRTRVGKPEREGVNTDEKVRKKS